MTVVQIIKDLQENSSRLKKEEILYNAWQNEDFDFFVGARWAYDPLITFGIKKLPARESTQKTGAINLFQEEDTSTTSFKDFSILVKLLNERELAGHAARDAVQNFANKCNADEWKYFYSKILIKDLRCGISSKTINKVLKCIFKETKDPIVKECYIQLFECALAQKSQDHENKMIGKKYIDFKYDGVRMLAIVRPGKSVEMYTRNGRLNDNFNYIKEYIFKSCAHLDQDIVLDGEIISKNFNELMTQVNRKKNVNTKDSEFWLFDIIPLSDFMKGKSNLTQENRHNMLLDMRDNFKDTPIKVLDKVIVDLDTQEGKDKLEELKVEALKLGLEGIMIKDINAPYECKRAVNWLKWKPTIKVDLKITGYEIGTGRNKDRLGAFICEGYDEENNVFIKTNVGGGYSDDMREEFWKNKDDLISELVEIEADAISQDKDGSYSLRFPRFVRFRTLDEHGKI